MGGGKKSDFLKVVQPCEKQVTLNSKELSAHGIHRLGIDGNALIHKTVPAKLKEKYVKATRESPDAALAQQVRSEIAGYVSQVVQRIARKTQKTVVTVFDGKDLPEKSDCLEKRKEQRQKAFDKKEFAQAFDCDERIVEECRKALNQVRSNSSIIAAYEADHQLVYLFNNEKIDAVLAEDTDFLLWQIPLLRQAEGLGSDKDDIRATLIDLKKDYEKCPDLVDSFLPTKNSDVYEGVITFWKYSSAASKKQGGFGFIKCTETRKKLPSNARGKTLFFHASNVKQAGFKNCSVGSTVEFILAPDDRLPQRRRAGDNPFVGVRVTGIGGSDVPKSEAQEERIRVKNIFPYQREIALGLLLIGNDYNGAHIPRCGVETVKKHLKAAMWDPVRFVNLVRRAKTDAHEDDDISRDFIKSIKRAQWLVQHAPVKDEYGNTVPLSGDPNVQKKDPLFAGTQKIVPGDMELPSGSTALPSGSTEAGETKRRGRKGRGKKGKGKRKGKGKGKGKGES
ncbi:unnamed protein product [Amoebophrya sp. A120]|nr:unnamed protein product [Amoebophrya sp. A120]|eukprot:GSA120T00002116001.1